MEIKKLKTAEIRPAPYNPRKKLKPGDKEYEKLKASITEFGYVDPVIVNERTGHVVGGHQRLQVLMDLGYTEVDCVVLDLPDAKEKALNVALNKIAGAWDIPMLKNLLLDLDAGGFDLGLTGFDNLEVDDLLGTGGVKEDNFDVDGAVAQIKEPQTKPGDVVLLGNHRLLCGDATKITDIDRLMNGNSAEMVFTDPPYNVNYTGGTIEKLKIKNDNMPEEDFGQFLTDSFTSMFVATRPGGAVYVCHADSAGRVFRASMSRAGWEIKQCLIWVKNALVLGRQDYQWRHEPILYGWKPGAAHAWYGGRKQSTVIDNSAPITIKRGPDGVELTFKGDTNLITIKVPSYEVVSGVSEEESSIWNFNKPTKNADHPTMKPIALCARAIQNSSKQDEIVLDLFGGSGSTLIACEEVGRRCYMMELDPVYCDVIIKRWETLTGQKARLAEVN